MKKSQLRSLIKEEIQKVLKESSSDKFVRELQSAIYMSDNEDSAQKAIDMLVGLKLNSMQWNSLMNLFDAYAENYSR
jgi:hypothetical protein